MTLPAETARARTGSGPRRMIARAALAALGIIAAGGLIWWLAASLDTGGADLWELLRGIPVWAWAALVALTAAQFLISAVKWTLVTRRLFPEDRAVPGIAAVTLYTAVGAVLGIFVTVYVGTVASRALAMRLLHRRGVGRNAAATVLEQGFDVAAMACFAVAAAAVLFLGIGWIWLVVLPPLFAMAGGALLLRSRHVVAWLRARLRGAGSARDADTMTTAVDRLLTARMVAVLLGASGLRFLVLALRVVVVVLAIGQTVPLMDVTLAFPLVQASQLASLTPGNIGIAEWTWVGLLMFQGGTLETAGAFALVLRLAGLAALGATTGLLAAILLVRRVQGAHGRNPAVAGA
ncbi:MAG: flippase-like domain-containing protein [Rhodospirillaceae bacterium]|nr:flippase-like domain-containing protein [Rhodospirillaceae bacterium]